MIKGLKIALIAFYCQFVRTVHWSAEGHYRTLIITPKLLTSLLFIIWSYDFLHNKPGYVLIECWISKKSLTLWRLYFMIMVPLRILYGTFGVCAEDPDLVCWPGLWVANECTLGGVRWRTVEEWNGLCQYCTFPWPTSPGPLAAQIKFVAPCDLVSGLLCLAVTVKGVSETQ